MFMQVHSTDYDERCADSPLVPLWHLVLVEGQDIPPLEQEQ
jgi:hypothetical protein